MKLVAVEDMELDFGETSVPEGGVTLGPASTTVLVDGKGVYAGALSISITGASQGSNTAGAGTGTFVPGAMYCSADGEKLLLEGDTATFLVNGVDASTAPVSWSVTATVKSAGQNSVSAE